MRESSLGENGNLEGSKCLEHDFVNVGGVGERGTLETSKGPGQNLSDF